MGWGRYIKVEPGALRMAAGEAERIGDALGKRVNFARQECASASSKHAGFQVSAALEGCVAAWEDNVRRLAGSITGVGERLTQCAKTYTDTDESIAGGMRFK